MTLDVRDYRELDYAQRVQFRSFCAAAAASDEPASGNMLNLPELIAKRFTERGVMFVVFDGTRIVACSGAYFAEFNSEIGLCGVRTWVNKSHRNQQIVRNLLLPVQREWMKERGAKCVALTFNDYNRHLVDLFKRQVVKREPRSPYHMFFHNMWETDFQVVIQFTPQWVLFETLDPAWTFNWESVRYVPPVND